MAPRADLPKANNANGLDCQTGLKGRLEPKGISGTLTNLHQTRDRLLAELREIDATIATDEARQERQARERSMTVAVARSRVFRDGTPRDKAGHAEIARRYAWHAYKGGKRPATGQTGKSKLITLIRLRELERIISARYGAELPNNAAGRDMATIAGHHIVHFGADAARHIMAWASVWAPWMPPEQAAELAAGIIARPWKFTADTLGWRLQLSQVERQSLAITTIGAFDLDKAQRVQLRKVRRAAAESSRRRRKGAIPREHYEEASLSANRPWEALGISRATWYRRGRPAAPDSPKSSQMGGYAPNLGGLAREAATEFAHETSARPAGSSYYAERIPVSGSALRAADYGAALGRAGAPTFAPAPRSSRYAKAGRKEERPPGGRLSSPAVER